MLLLRNFVKKKLLWTGESTPKLVLNCKIIEYDKGNAFKRWLYPSWGITLLNIQCELKDRNKVVGSARARHTVSAGGLYTIGAWKFIFS